MLCDEYGATNRTCWGIRNPGIAGRKNTFCDRYPNDASKAPKPASRVQVSNLQLGRYPDISTKSEHKFASQELTLFDFQVKNENPNFLFPF